MRPFPFLPLSAAALAGGIVVVAGSVSSAERGAGSAAAGHAAAPAPVQTAPLQSFEDPVPAVRRAFTFTRGIYSDYRARWGRGSWSTDYPKADRQFLTVLRRLTNVDALHSENALALDDPELRRFPFIYMLEVGSMSLSPAEVTG
ncbi:MAG TPA: DUF4159 domain-containing protein, partial [Longimicrobiales bacterium]|nr:DUF4159 domain-containing protein [Longimicrobiales bacterium]